MRWNQKQKVNTVSKSMMNGDNQRRKHLWIQNLGFQSRYSRAKIFKTIGLVSLCVILIFSLLSLVTILNWYEPVQAQTWFVYSESYSQNLLVDQTVPSERSGVKLVDLMSRNQSAWLSPENVGILPETRSELRSLSQLDLDQLNISDSIINSNILFFHFFCHGLSDEKGPFLLKNWITEQNSNYYAPPGEDSKIRIQKLLEAIVNASKGKQIVVVFDVEQSIDFEQLGILNNQFSEKLMDLEPWISSHNNLIVITSTSTNEMSHVDLYSNESLFGKTWRNHFTSPSHLGTSFNLSSLFNSVKQKVFNESVKQYGTSQNLQMFPSGAEGRNRAEAVLLRTLISGETKLPRFSEILESGKTDSTDASLRVRVNEPRKNQYKKDVVTLQQTDLIQVWDDYRRLSQISPPPYWKFPNKWMIYKAAIKRYEQLIMSEDFSSANLMYSKIQQLVQELSQPLVMPRHLIHSTMTTLEKYFIFTNEYQPEWLKPDFEKAWGNNKISIEESILELGSKLINLPEIPRSEIHTSMFDSVNFDKRSFTNVSNSSSTSSTVQSESNQTPKNNKISGSTQNKDPLKSNNDSVIEETKTDSVSSDEKNSKNAIETKDTKNYQEKNNQKEASPVVVTSDSNSISKMKENPEFEKKAESDNKNATNSDVNTEENNGLELKPELDTGKKVNQLTIAELASKMPTYQRFWLYLLITEKLNSGDLDTLDRAVKWVTLLKPANEILPLEFHLLSILNRDLTAFQKNPTKSLREIPLKLMIQNCIVFTKVINNRPNHLKSRQNYFNQNFLWFYPQVLKADQSFSIGWDHFFSFKDEDINLATSELSKSYELYNQIYINSADLKNTLDSYLYAIERLNNLSKWSYRYFFQISNRKDNPDLLSSNYSLISECWSVLNQLTESLSYEMDYQLDEKQRSDLIERVKQLGIKLNQNVDKIQKLYYDECEKIIQKSGASLFDYQNYIAIEEALKVMDSDVKIRRKLFDAYLNLKLLRSQNEYLSDNHTSDINFRDYQSLLNYYLADFYSKYYYASGAIISQTLPLPNSQINNFINSNTVSYQQKATTGNNILALLMENLNEISKNQNFRKESIDFHRVWLSERLIRVLPLGFLGDASDLHSRINIVKINSMQLRLNAQRLWNFHWGPLSDNDIPYWENLSRTCLDFAENSNRELNINIEEIQSLRTKIFNSSLPILKTPEVNYASGSPIISVPVSFEVLPGSHIPDGNATIWIDSDQILKPIIRNSESLSSLATFKDLNLLLTDSLWEESQESRDQNLAIYQSSLKTYLLFRGNRQDSITNLKIFRVPSWSDYRPKPSPGSSVSLQASEIFLEKYGRSSGSVSFVLDCSGSMGPIDGQPWNDTVKYSQAVNSLIETIQTLPAQTNVSIWVFGEAVGLQKSAKSSDTIRKVIGPISWNPSDLNLLDEIKNRISYPECLPWNRSPILETMRRAAEDLSTSKPPHLMIVITDGQDTGLEIESDQNIQKSSMKQSQKNLQISEQIRSLFTPTDISVNVIGFKLENEEAKSVQDQFEVVRDLPTPGIYTNISNEIDLSNSINSILRRKLFFRIDTPNNQSLRSRMIPGVEIQKENTFNYWIEPYLKPGIYKIWTDLGQRVENQLILKDSDRMMLMLKDDLNETPMFFRNSWLKSNYGFRPTDIHNQWNLFWVASRTENKRIKLLLGVDYLDENLESGKVLEMPDPKDWHFRVLHPDNLEQNLVGSVERCWNYPASMWVINVENYPSDTTNPVIQMEMNPNRLFSSELILNQGQEFHDINSLIGESFRFYDSQVKIENIGIEFRWVPQDESEKLRKEKCWVLRVKGKSGDLIRPDLNFEEENRLHKIFRYFELTGTSEVLLWDGSSKGLDISRIKPSSIVLSNLKQLEKKSTQINRNSEHIHFEVGKSLKLPMHGDLWPNRITIEMPRSVPSESFERNSESNSMVIPKVLSQE